MDFWVSILPQVLQNLDLLDRHLQARPAQRRHQRFAFS